MQKVPRLRRASAETADFTSSVLKDTALIHEFKSSSKRKNGFPIKKYSNILFFLGLAFLFTYQQRKLFGNIMTDELDFEQQLPNRTSNSLSISRTDNDNLTSINNGSADENSQLPKLVIHVGPFKTGTTTIQSAIFHPSKRYDTVRAEMVKDNFKRIDLTWLSGMHLVNHLNALENNASTTKGNNKYNSLKQELKIARELKQHVALSHEGLSKLRKSKEARASFLSLTEGYDVRIVMSYRPLESYYKSWYIESRSREVYKTGAKTAHKLWTSPLHTYNQYGSVFPEWFTHIRELNGGSDPLYTYEIYKYVFGEERIKVLELFHPDRIDIVQQLICKGMEAKHSCEKLKQAGPPKQKNKAKETTPYDEDLVVMAARLKHLLPYENNGRNTNCTVTPRHIYAEELRNYLRDVHNHTIMDYNKTCISTEILGAFRERSWEAEQRLASSPKSRASFEASFQKMVDTDRHCSIDVNATFNNPVFVDFFRNETRCVGKRYRKR